MGEKGYDYLVNKKDNDNAINAYNKVIQLDPQHEGAYCYRGDAYKNKGQYDLAIADYNKVIQLSLQNADEEFAANTYCNRGLAYKDKGQLDLAISDFTKL